MKKRKLTPEEIAYSEARLARLRERERALREAAEEQTRTAEVRKRGWRGKLGLG